MVEQLKKLDVYLIIILGTFILATNNLINCIAETRPPIEYFTYSGFFYLITIITYIAKRRKWYRWNAYFFTLVGLLTIFSAETDGNYSGLILVIFSIYIFNTRLSNIVLSVLTFLVILSKGVFQDFTIPQTFNLLIAHIIIVIIYYILIHPKKPHIITNFNIDYENQQILELLAAGYSNKEIADKVFISANAVTKRLLLLRIKFDSKTNCQLVYKISTKGYYRHE